MANGQTALSLSDLPFSYSFINLIFILIIGEIKIENFYIVGVIAGMIGTLLVFWHPIQWIIDKIINKRKNDMSTYIIENPNHDPSKYEIIIDDEIMLSLKTSPIKFLKDKIVSQIYYIILLCTFGLALFNPIFHKVIQLDGTIFPIYIQLGILFMAGLSLYILIKNVIGLGNNIKIVSVYFHCYSLNTNLSEAIEIVKESFNLNDWISAKKYLDTKLRRHWRQLGQISVKK